MRIIGKGDAPITVVELRLNSIQMGFRHCIKPDVPIEQWMLEAGRDTKAIICFDDSAEVDMFVRILEEFSRCKTEYLGEWAKTNPWDSRSPEAVLGKLIEKERT